MNDLQEFVQVFGNRFPGLHDPGNTVYQTYRVPYPEAPYPQDYLIDQDGRIAYWSDEYDPQELIRIIDELLGYTSVEDGIGNIIPNTSRIISAYPNPFNEQAVISFELREAGFVSLKVYDLLGREVSRMSSGQVGRLKAGQHSLTWNAEGLSSGVYYVELSVAGNQRHDVRKVVLLK